MVCGFIESADLLATPVFRTLPSLSVVRATEDKVGALIASTVREIAALADAAEPGSQAVLGRLVELRVRQRRCFRDVTGRFGSRARDRHRRASRYDG